MKNERDFMNSTSQTQMKIPPGVLIMINAPAFHVRSSDLVSYSDVLFWRPLWYHYRAREFIWCGTCVALRSWRESMKGHGHGTSACTQEMALCFHRIACQY